MGADLRGVKTKFASLMEDVRPMITSQFVVWLDEKVAEFKVQGYMNLDIVGDAPKWIRDYSMSVILADSVKEASAFQINTGSNIGSSSRRKETNHSQRLPETHSWKENFQSSASKKASPAQPPSRTAARRKRSSDDSDNTIDCDIIEIKKERIDDDITMTYQERRQSGSSHDTTHSTIASRAGDKVTNLRDVWSSELPSYSSPDHDSASLSHSLTYSPGVVNKSSTALVPVGSRESVATHKQYHSNIETQSYSDSNLIAGPSQELDYDYVLEQSGDGSGWEDADQQDDNSVDYKGGITAEEISESEMLQNIQFSINASDASSSHAGPSGDRGASGMVDILHADSFGIAAMSAGPIRPGVLDPAVAAKYQMVELLPGTRVYCYEKQLESIKMKSFTADGKMDGRRMARHLMSVFFQTKDLLNASLSDDPKPGQVRLNPTIVDTIIELCIRSSETNPAWIRHAMWNKITSANTQMKKKKEMANMSKNHRIDYNRFQRFEQFSDDRLLNANRMFAKSENIPLKDEK